MALEQGAGGESFQDEDPMSERMVEARKTTFGDVWPHEKKRGWTCKIQKVGKCQDESWC
jgi:hypothetical protein